MCFRNEISVINLDLTCGMYYKQVMTVIYDCNDIGLYYKTRDDRNWILALASIINYNHQQVTLQFGASLTDDTRSVNYDRNTFIIQATGSSLFL